MDSCRAAAREALQQTLKSDGESYAVDVSSIFADISLSELLDDISSDETQSTATSVCENLVVAEAFLSNAEELRSTVNAEEKDAITALFSWTASTILPRKTFVGLWEKSQLGYDNEAKDANLKPARLISSTGTSVLQYLNAIIPIHQLDDAVQTKVITALAAFTHRSDPWTTERAFTQASTLLEAYRAGYTASSKSQDTSLIPRLGEILKSVIKPAFAKTKNPAITPAGRRAEHPVPPPRFDPSLFDEGSKPWKFKDVYVVTVLRWIVQQYRPSDHALIEAQFPFLVPPILSLIDDESLAYKAVGCDILHKLLRPLADAQSNILQRTNLDSVFQDAVGPCLLSLPTITPENESIHLLKAAYPALFSVIQTRYPPTTPEKPTTSSRRSGQTSKSSRASAVNPDSEPSSPRVAALTRILRDNLLPSYHHTSNPRPVESATTATGSLASYPYPTLSTLLLSNLTHITTLLGTNITPYLRDILPVLTETLSNPFGTAALDLLLAAARASRELVLAGWMRIWRWRADVLRGVCACWIRLGLDEEDVLREQGREGETKVAELRGLLRDVVGLLKIAVEEVTGGEEVRAEIEAEAGGRIVIGDEYLELVSADEKLGGLLIPDEGE